MASARGVIAPHPEPRAFLRPDEHPISFRPKTGGNSNALLPAACRDQRCRLSRTPNAPRHLSDQERAGLLFERQRLARPRSSGRISRSGCSWILRRVLQARISVSTSWATLAARKSQCPERRLFLFDQSSTYVSRPARRALATARRSAPLPSFGLAANSRVLPGRSPLAGISRRGITQEREVFGL